MIALRTPIEIQKPPQEKIEEEKVNIDNNSNNDVTDIKRVRGRKPGQNNIKGPKNTKPTEVSAPSEEPTNIKNPKGRREDPTTKKALQVTP